MSAERRPFASMLSIFGYAKLCTASYSHKGDNVNFMQLMDERTEQYGSYECLVIVSYFKKQDSFSGIYLTMCEESRWR